MSEPLATFRGTVKCRRSTGAPQLTVEGVDAAGDAIAVCFSGVAPPGLPDSLQDAVVLPGVSPGSASTGNYRIACGGREWTVPAYAVHLHRDVAAPFLRALPPRPVPHLKRLAWRAVLALSGSRAGIALLTALRRATPRNHASRDWRAPARGTRRAILRGPRR